MFNFNISEKEKFEDGKVLHDFEKKETDGSFDHPELVFDFIEMIKKNYTEMKKDPRENAELYLADLIEKIRLHANNEVLDDGVKVLLQGMSKNDAYFCTGELDSFLEKQRIIN